MGLTGPATPAASPARHLRLPGAATELSADLAWLALVTRGRIDRTLTRSIMEHHRRTRCEPAILVAAAIQYLIHNADREPDSLNRYWHLADQVSARTRSRYLYIEEQDLQ